MTGTFTKPMATGDGKIIAPTGKRFAIILDGKVLSAPVIQEPIIGGQARISGSFSVESANQLAISLRSGALPVDLGFLPGRRYAATVLSDGKAAGSLAAARMRAS